MSCQTKNTEQVSADSVSTSVQDEKIEKTDDREDNTVRIFPLDSILEINYYTYKTSKGESKTSGVNVIDRQIDRRLFDSDGPQIESNSDVRKISDSYYVISVYYDVPVSDDTNKKSVKIASFDLKLNPDTKTYTFLKDTLFWHAPAPFRAKDIQKTIKDYKGQISAEFMADSTSNDQPQIGKMFGIQERLLSAYISGCDSCLIYSERLFQKYDHALFASDADYAGEIGSVFSILNKR